MGNDDTLILGVLNAVGVDSRASQRELAQQLGIALGLANACLKRCVKKGFVKMTQAPANRYMYYLTPTGFAEKARLTADYLSQSFGFFRAARAQCAEVVDQCAAAGFHRVAMVGASDLCEILVLCTAGTNVNLVGLLDAGGNGPRPHHLPCVTRRELLPAHDAVVVTALTEAQATYDRLRVELGRERIFAPAMLGIACHPLTQVE